MNLMERSTKRISGKLFLNPIKKSINFRFCNVEKFEREEKVEMSSEQAVESKRDGCIELMNEQTKERLIHT